MQNRGAAGTEIEEMVGGDVVRAGVNQLVIQEGSSRSGQAGLAVPVAVKGLL